MINLDMGDINPHMAFAPNMAACPFQQIFSICYCYVFNKKSNLRLLQIWNR